MQPITEAELRTEIEQLRKRIGELEAQARETDRILHENTLRQEKEWSQKIIDNAPNIILGLLENSKIVVFNRFAERLTGYRTQEVVGKEWISTFIPKEKQGSLYRVWNEILDNQQMDHPFECEIVTKSGELRLIKWHNTVLTENDEFRMILSLGEDITKQKETYAALHQANKQLRMNYRKTRSILEDLKVEVQARQDKEAELLKVTMAVEQAGEVIVITDPAGTIQYANPAFETVTGYSRKEILGQNLRIFKSGDQDEAFYRDLWDRITRGQTWKGRMVNKRKDGRRYTEEATISPVFDAADQIINYVAVKRDITEQLELTAQIQQAQKLESVGRLAGGVAHDYNNMLSIIIGYAQLAMDKAGATDPLYAPLREIDKAAQRSTEITRKLLGFARKQTICPVVLDLNTAIEGMLKMLRRLLREDLTLYWHPGAGVWQIYIDPSQMDQILMNLCINARDAIEGTGEILIETRNVVFDPDYCELHKGFTPGEYVMAAISDNGCGMDQNTLDLIFEPFFTTKKIGQGTGLGLAMVYGIIKQNNGFINVYSEPGQGTTLKMYFPRDKTGINGGTEPKEKKPDSGRGETILLVEDEPTLLTLATQLLESLNYTVLGASHPDEALHLAEKHAGKICLLLTDVVMPEMNGRELADRLSARYTDMKLLFMSGYTADVIASQGILDKGMHFIQKPVTLHALAAKVRQVLDSQ
jgi:PAS domain S-box-containing protein